MTNFTEAILDSQKKLVVMNQMASKLMESYTPALDAVAKQQGIADIIMKSFDFSKFDHISREISRFAEERFKWSQTMMSKIDVSFFHQPVISRLQIPYETADCEEKTIPKHIISKTPFILYDSIKNGFLVNGTEINFPDEKADYVAVLKALFTLSQNNKICFFQEIDKFLQDAGLKHIRSRRGKNKRIHNAIAHLQRKKADGSINFPLYTPDGTKVIRNVRRQGFIFDNPLIQ